MLSNAWTAIVSLVVLVSVCAQASATVLTFDDISAADQPPIPAGYGGLNWSGDNLRALNSTTFTPSVTEGYKNGTVSGDYVGIFRSGGTVSAPSGTFTFNGAYFTAAWNDGLTLSVVGKLGGTELFSTTLTIDSVAAVFYTFDWAGIDELVLASSGGVNAGYGGSGPWVAYDNFTINEPIVATPEPAGLVLLALGLAALGVPGRCGVRRVADVDPS